MIHALGAENRRDYAARPLRIDGAPVTSIAPDYSGWEGWNRRANWPFFAALQTHYRPIARNDQHLVWMPRTAPVEPTATACRVEPISASAFAIVVPGTARGTASVRVKRYGAPAPSRSALITVSEDSPVTRSADGSQWGGFPAYGVPNERAILVPAPLQPGQETRLTFNVMDGSAIGAATCSAEILSPIDTAALPSLPRGIESYLAEAAS
jgi:hypothetical protein